MNYGFYRLASITPNLILGDTLHNTKLIKEEMHLAAKEQVSVAVFPELTITGSTLQDLLTNQLILAQSEHALKELISESKDLNTLFVIGLPYRHLNTLYNVMAVIYQGELLGLVPKSHHNHNSYQFNSRTFSSGPKNTTTIFNQQSIPFGTHLLFRNTQDEQMIIGVEIGEDMWAPQSPSIAHALAGATIIVNGSAAFETVTKASHLRQLINSTSAKLLSAYALASAGTYESSTDGVYAGHNLISENGYLLIESELFKNQSIITEVDVNYLSNLRLKTNFFHNEDNRHQFIDFTHNPDYLILSRTIPKNPFIVEGQMEQRAKLILNIQAEALKRRLTHIKSETAIIGLSGGQDSTLALIATVLAYEKMELDPQNIITVSMPGLGTTKRTNNNAKALAQAFKTTYLEIDITDATKLHFRDIDHDKNKHDSVFENSQARERTQILMDLANKYNGIVIGTGGLSELALGWATYNGDHMSMYGLNAGIPKTLIRILIDYYAKNSSTEIEAILKDVLSTPVSPELLPAQDGEISQKTEELVGPYALHDFFLYYFVAAGFSPSKIRYLAKQVFEDGEVDRWLPVFIKRFIANQYKRSALPDGPTMGSVNLSPRSGYKMPSDSVSTSWLEDLNKEN